MHQLLLTRHDESTSSPDHQTATRTSWQVFIPNGVSLVYGLDRGLKFIRHYHLGRAVAAARATAAVAA